MKNVALLCSLIFGLSNTTVPAGDVVTLTDSPEVNGKLTLGPSSLHVDGASPVDVNLPDVLEADFNDAPFQLNYFSSVGDASTQLPAGWKGQDIGPIKPPGTALYANGSLTLTGGGTSAKEGDMFSFVGLPWTTDGQWTARVQQIADQGPSTEVGLMLREGLDADSPQVAVGATNKVNGRKLFGPEVVFQANAGSIGKRERLHQPPLPIQLPIWLRLTQSGGSVDASISTDGKDWELVSEHTLKSWIGAWAGFYLNSHEDNETGKAVVDQISFTPPPCSAQTLSPGILLRSGSFLAGTLNTLDLDPTKPDGSGSFSRNGKNVILARSKVAVITMQPTQRSDIADMSSQVGLIMKNGDFLAGEPDGISGGGVHINSVALGIVSYTPAQVRACILHPLQTQAANYEIRLKDGSLVRASGMSVNNAQIVINEVSGINVTAGLDEIAQFRAGPAQVQTLLDLPWKATPPPANTPPAANPTPAANPAVPANPAPAANPIPDGTAPPQCWEGNNQEQIMMASAGTVVDFPLTGRFRALALRFALSPDAPPNAQASLSILADGREIGRTPPFRAGDSPRYIEMTLQNAKTVSFVADSIFAGTKVLFIDPVAIRGN